MHARGVHTYIQAPERTRNTMELKARKKITNTIERRRSRSESADKFFVRDSADRYTHGALRFAGFGDEKHKAEIGLLAAARMQQRGETTAAKRMCRCIKSPGPRKPWEMHAVVSATRIIEGTWHGSRARRETTRSRVLAFPHRARALRARSLYALAARGDIKF